MAAAFERGPLGSHVAVRDCPPFALPAHCFAGDYGRHRERHRRHQKNLHICAVCYKRLPGCFTWLMAGGTFILCRCDGDQGWLCNGLRGANPSTANEGSRVLFGVCRYNLVDSNGRRASSLLSLACLGDLRAWPERAETGLTVAGLRPLRSAHMYSAPLHGGPGLIHSYPFLSTLLSTLIHRRVYLFCVRKFL